MIVFQLLSLKVPECRPLRRESIVSMTASILQMFLAWKVRQRLRARDLLNKSRHTRWTRSIVCPMQPHRQAWPHRTRTPRGIKSDALQ